VEAGVPDEPGFWLDGVEAGVPDEPGFWLDGVEAPRKKSAAAKKLSAHGVEQAFRLAVKSKEKPPSLRRRPSRSAKREAT